LILLEPIIANIISGQERFEEAKEIVVQYHANGDESHPIVNLEMTEMVDSLKEAGMMTWKSIFDVRNLFNTRSRRYRLALCIAFSWFGQFSGNNIASYVRISYKHVSEFALTYIYHSTFHSSSKTWESQIPTPYSCSMPFML
jgi:hypothetical protein